MRNKQKFLALLLAVALVLLCRLPPWRLAYVRLGIRNIPS